MLKSHRGILALLTALNFVNYVDRYVVNSISPSIQESLHLSDSQVGWVGSVFMFGYFLTSPIFGWLGDRYPRKGLIALGVAIWSIATAVSGLAGSYAGILAARVAVGVGEASYATLAPTIIDDISTPETKNRWLAIFYVAIPVGFSLGFLLGARVDHLYGWRAAFFVASGPGFVLALITLLMKEPGRSTTERAARAPSSAYLELAKNPVYTSTVLGYVGQTFALGGFALWAEFFLERKLCLDRHDGAIAFGAISAVTGLVGTGFGGWLSDRLPGEDRVKVCLRVCAWSSALAAPLGLAAILMPGATGFLIMLGFCELAVFTATSPTNAAVLMSVPPYLRANAMAASIFAIHLLGDLISPPIVGSISEALGDVPKKCSGATGLQTGMYLLPAMLAVSAVFWWRGSRSSAPAPAAAG